MSLRVPVLVSVALLALVGAPTASAAKPLKAPKGLKAFLLRANEPESLYGRTVTRTPAVAWSPVRGAKRYELELATSESFSESSMIWTSEGSNAVKLTSPAATVPVSLPWMTGNPGDAAGQVWGE